MDWLKYKVLFAEGDSWTSGDIIDPNLADEINGNVNHPKNNDYRLPKVWPEKLSHLLKVRPINNAHAGSSNDGIVRRTINYLLQLLQEYPPEEILVIIGFSSPERKDFYYKHNKSAGWDVIYPLDNFQNSQEREDFKKNYVKIYWNEEEYLTRYLNSVLYLHTFLKTKNIDHIFFNAFYQDDTSKLNSKSFLKMIKRFEEKHSSSFLDSLGVKALLKEYYKINQKVFLNTSFKNYIDFKPGKNYDNIHPSENGHELWAKYLFNFIKERQIKCIEDNITAATLYNVTKEALEPYKDIPEIVEKDTRGYDMIRPLYSHTGLNKVFEIDSIQAKKFDFNNNFYYFVFCHHNMSLVGKYLSILPEYVLEGIRNKKCKLILDDSLEGRHISYLLDTLYRSIEELKLIPSQIYYITNNLLAEDQHKTYSTNKNIKELINVVSYMYNVYDVQRLIYSPSVNAGARLPKHFDFNKAVEYKKQNLHNIKPFLKINRTGRPERNLFMLFINKNNLYSKFKISFPEYGEEGSYDLFPDLTTEKNINSLKSKIPFDIDQTDKDNHGPPGIGKGKFDADLPFQVKNYDDTFISVIMCAFPFDEACHLHSSTFNPIYCGHPIIQFGPKGSLAELRKRGFKTFGKWWDESYDGIENGWERLKAIFKLIEELSKKSNKELLFMYKDMAEVLNHNSNLIYNYDIYNNLVNKIRFTDEV